MFAVTVSDVLWILGSLVVMAGLLWLARRIDPHWVAKDGRAFTCRIQPIRPDGRVEGRWRDARAVVEGQQVRLVVRGMGSMSKQPFEAHRVIGRSAEPPARSAVFVLEGDPVLWALRVPERSKAVAVLDTLVVPV